ncbi:uncharacterized protein [Panulirus ornatus]|uniref:uncharacterized protein isoform X2 n=1 Tax=Panulirus ornatus TaxID=150431 RepID=UPI003A8B3D3E
MQTKWCGRQGQWITWWIWASLLTLIHIFLWRERPHTAQILTVDSNMILMNYKLCVKKTCLRRNLRHPILEADDMRVVRHLRRMMDPPPREPAGQLDPQRPPWHTITSYNATETIIRALLGNTVGGVFVEVGAQDGLWLSNTWWLEAARGWRGLLLEADPHNYLQLRSSPRASTSLPVCVTTSEAPRKETLVRVRRSEGWNTTIGMHQRGRTMLVQYATSADVYLGQTWNAICYPFLSVVAAAGFKRIDLLMFDVAGGGFELVQEFMTANEDFKNPYKVQVILYQDTSLVDEAQRARDASELGYTHLPVSAAHFLLIHNSLNFVVG